MLGWVLGRGSNAPGEAGENDTTQIEQPDTPAPVVAARALKSAIFGTPAAARNSSTSSGFGANSRKSTTAPTKSDNFDNDDLADLHTPVKQAPTGILLTPGTGTSRPKRVSFGRDIVTTANTNNNAAGGGGGGGTGLSKSTSLWGGRSKLGGSAFRRSRLTETLEKSRAQPKKIAASASADAATATTTAATAPTKPTIIPTSSSTSSLVSATSTISKMSDDAASRNDEQNWVESADSDPEDYEDYDSGGEPDVTVDLNEPHSRSGKYWKSYFEKYHSDAKAEMEKLLKYKQLAKSYAKGKDAEAVGLAEKLREEQEKVMRLESKIVETAARMASSRLSQGATGGSANDDRNAEDEEKKQMRSLTLQTAQAVDSRQRVQELEEMLEALVNARNDENGSNSRATTRTKAAATLGTSPRTQKTLLEAQRQLRQAREQTREISTLQRQVKRLEAELEASKSKLSRAEEENKRLLSAAAAVAVAAPSLSSASATETTSTAAGSARAQELRIKLRDAEEACRCKDAEMRTLKEDFEDFKEETQIREEDARRVLERLTEKMTELKKENRSLRTSSRSTVATRSTETVGTELVRPPPRRSFTSLAARRSADDVEKPDRLARDERASTRSLRDNYVDHAEAAPTRNPSTSARYRNNRHSWAAPATIPDFDQDGGDDDNKQPQQTKDDTTVMTTLDVLADKINRGKPRWHSFVPRSPSKAKKAAQSRGLAAEASEPSQDNKGDHDDFSIDLLRGKFAPLGGGLRTAHLDLGPTEPQDEAADAAQVVPPRTTLSPERREAALQRLQRRKSEKPGYEGESQVQVPRRSRTIAGYDKENRRPL